MKRIIALLMVVSMLFAVAACGGSNQKKTDQSNNESIATKKADDASEDQTVLRIMTRWGEGEDTSLDAHFHRAIEAFQVANPDIKVENESVPGSDDSVFFDKIKSSIAVGDAPDIIYNYGGGVNYEYITNDVFVDLTPYFEEDPEWFSAIEKYIDLWQIPGVEGIYGVPLKVFYNTLYYNQDLFDEFGLEVPKTLQEFEEVSKVFLENDIIPMSLGNQESWRGAHLATVLTMVEQGPEFIDKLGTREVKHTDPEMLEVYERLKEWDDMGIFGPYSISTDSEMEKTQFLTGKSAMHMNGTWFLSTLGSSEEIKTTNFDVTAFPYNAEKEEFQNYTMGSSNGGLSVYNSGDEDRIEAAIRFLKFIQSKEMVASYYEGGALDFSAAEYDGLAPNFPDEKIFDDYNKLVLELTVKQEVDCYDPLPQMVDIFRDSIQGIFAGGTAEECAESIQAEIERSGK